MPEERDLEPAVPELEFLAEAGTLHMRILDSRQVLPPHVDRLDAAMRQLARARDVALLPIAVDSVRTVHPTVAPLWIKKIANPEFRLRAIAVVTSRSAVRVVANGVGKAANLLGSPLAMQVFGTEAEARAWLTSRGFLDERRSA